MKIKNKKPPKPFKVRSARDYIFALELKYDLKCSQATMYRTLHAAKIPTYNFVECLRHIKFISGFNLYRLVRTPAFKKYFQALTQYAPIPDAEPCEETISVAEAQTKLELTDWEMDAGIKAGLIPAVKIENEIKISGWFLPAVERVYPCF